jgi:hypothetical protein
MCRAHLEEDLAMLGLIISQQAFSLVSVVTEFHGDGEARSLDRFSLQRVSKQAERKNRALSTCALNQDSPSWGSLAPPPAPRLCLSATSHKQSACPQGDSS